MKMGTLEKRFVNAAPHSRQVAERAVARLRDVPFETGWRYLDVGCGNGVATVHVARTLGLRAVGVDMDPDQIDLARRAAGNAGGVTFVTASATRLPFTTGEFEIVATNKALHHVPEWRLAIDELKRIVAPGGYIVFADLSVPTTLAPLLRLAVGHEAGIFSCRDLDRGFAGLRQVRRHSWWLHYEAVFTKP